MNSTLDWPGSSLTAVSVQTYRQRYRQTQETNKHTLTDRQTDRETQTYRHKDTDCGLVLSGQRSGRYPGMCVQAVGSGLCGQWLRARDESALEVAPPAKPAYGVHDDALYKSTAFYLYRQTYGQTTWIYTDRQRQRDRHRDTQYVTWVNSAFQKHKVTEQWHTINFATRC